MVYQKLQGKGEAAISYGPRGRRVELAVGQTAIGKWVAVVLAGSGAGHLWCL